MTVKQNCAPKFGFATPIHFATLAKVRCLSPMSYDTIFAKRVRIGIFIKTNGWQHTARGGSGRDHQMCRSKYPYRFQPLQTIRCLSPYNASQTKHIRSWLAIILKTRILAAAGHCHRVARTRAINGYPDAEPPRAGRNGTHYRY